MTASDALQPLLTIELGVRGIVYDADETLLTGDWGGGGDEQDDSDDVEDDDVSVLSVSGADGELAAGPAGWIELSLWPRWVMRFAPNVTSRPGVAARHRDTSDAHRVYPARNRSISVTGLPDSRC